MSSILDALKKVDDPTARDGGYTCGIGATGPGNTGVRRLKRTRAIRNSAVLVLICLLLMGLGWAIFLKDAGNIQYPEMLVHLLGKKSPPSAGETTLPDRKTPAFAETGEKPAVSQGRPQLTPPPRTLPAAAVPVRPAEIRKKVPDKNRQRIRSARVPAAKPPRTAMSQPGDSGRGDPTGTAIRSKSVRTISPGQDARRTADSIKTDHLPIFRETSLALHAIAWSVEPAQRMAVINEEIVREGGTVGGYSVLRIDADEIILENNRGRWRLPSR